MATETFTEVYEGGLGTESTIIQMISSEEIKPWVPVGLVDAGVGETQPRIEETDAITDVGFGVSCGGENLDPDDTTPVCAVAAGEKVLVCVFGRCKVKVLHSDGAISINSVLCCSATEEYARIIGSTGYALGVAFKASAADDDVIPMFLNPSWIAHV